jgi:hypothetical protein
MYINLEVEAKKSAKARRKKSAKKAKTPDAKEKKARILAFSSLPH